MHAARTARDRGYSQYATTEAGLAKSGMKESNCMGDSVMDTVAEGASVVDDILDERKENLVICVMK